MLGEGGGREREGLAGAAQRGEHVELAAADPEPRVDLLDPVAHGTREPVDPAEHRHRLGVQVGALPVPLRGDPARESFGRAVRHRDEHAVKFADAALDSYARTGSKDALAAATRATLMIKAA